MPPLKEWTKEQNPQRIKGNPFAKEFIGMTTADKTRLQKQLNSRKAKYSNHKLVNEEYERLGRETFMRVYEEHIDNKPINNLLQAIRQRKRSDRYVI